MTRTDTHRPSVINPADYAFVAFEHIPNDYGLNPLEHAAGQAEERARIRAHMERTGGSWSKHEHGGNCHICGAHAIWTVCFHHIPSNSYIRTGQQCADKLEMAYDNMDAFKKDTIKRIEALAGKRKAEATLAELGLTEAWNIHQQVGWQDDTIRDAVYGVDEDGQGAYRDRVVGHDRAQDSCNIVVEIVDRLIRYGALSDKQTNFLRQLVERIPEQIRKQREYDARRAVEEAEYATAPPAPKGRVIVGGTILTVKVQESDYGNTLKMLVKADEGYKVWVTVPRHLDNAKRGDEIKIRVTLTPSDNDPKFAFGKRPTVVKGDS